MTETQDALLRGIDRFIEENKEAILRDIKTLVDIPSVEGAAADGAPFGAEVKRALDAVLGMAQRMGLSVNDHGGWFGTADLLGKTDTQLGAIAHIDVVPAGDGWDGFAPFEMAVRDGWVMGRGVTDDKGPAVLLLYVAKFLAQQGVQPYTLRLMFGTNEETHMGGLHHYLAENDPPAFCYTPDGEFPVGYAEKGLYHAAMISAPTEGRIVAFDGGVASNVVPATASATVRGTLAALHGTQNVTVESAGEGLVRISGLGKGGHASVPEGTVNAILLVVDYLLENGLCSESERAFLQAQHTLLCSTDGSSCGFACSDEIFGGLTCVGGTVHLENGVFTQSIDIRYPTTTTAEALTAALKRLAASANATLAPEMAAVPFVTDASSPAVQTLVRAFNDVTGQHAEPFSMGGGTYARHFPKAVSFGIEDESITPPAWVGSMHGPNEGISCEQLWRALKIYILGTLRLMEQPL